MEEILSGRSRLRELDKLFTEKEHELSLKIAAMPSNLAGLHLEALEFQIQKLINERNSSLEEIARVDALIPQTADKQFLNERQSAVAKLNAKARDIRKVEAQLETLSYEVSDIEKYIGFLVDLLQKLSSSEASSQIIGPIEFTHCPSCLSRLKESSDPQHCTVCGAPQNPESARSKYLQIKLDFQIQLRESSQLKGAKSLGIEEARADHRREKREYDNLLTEFSTRYDLSSSPRESFLAERNQRIGHLAREISYLQTLIETATEISKLSAEKDELNKKISQLKDRLTALSRSGDKRKREALTLISSIGCKILTMDLKRQEEFQAPKSLRLNFRDDAISVDDKMNFSESSNVILKNTGILSLFVAATQDKNFYHPRFLLMDNIEDKGMEQIRSHNFQKIIAEFSENAPAPHQIIFTTSMMNPELELEKYVIGPSYTREQKTLSLPPGITTN